MVGANRLLDGGGEDIPNDLDLSRPGPVSRQTPRTANPDTGAVRVSVVQWTFHPCLRAPRHVVTNLPDAAYIDRTENRGACRERDVPSRSVWGDRDVLHILIQHGRPL